MLECRRAGVSDAIAAALVFAVALVLRWPALSQPLDRDAALYALIGRRLSADFVPYVDFFDHKQPFAYLPYRVLGWIAPGSTMAVRLAAAAAAGVTAVLCFVLLRRIVGRAHAALAATVVVVASAADVVEGADLNTEHILAPVAVLVVLGAVTGARRKEWWVPFACGLGVAAATLIKAVGIFVTAPALLPLVLAARARRDTIRTVACFAAGAAILPALILVAYAMNGGLGELWFGNVEYNLRYVGSFPALPPWRWLAFPAAVQVLVAVALGVAMWRLVLRRGRDTTVWTILLWLAGAIGGAKLGRRDIAHYLAPVIVPAAVAACMPVFSGGAAAAKRSLALTAVLGLGVVSPFAYDVGSRVGRDGDALAVRHYGTQAHIWTAQDEAGAWLRSRARRNDRLFVTGAEPAFYWLSGIEPASHYLFDYPHQLDRARFEERLRHDLGRDPPRFLALTAPGNWPSYLSVLRRMPYRHRATFGPVRIFELRR